MSDYTFTIVDSKNLLSADIKAKIKTDVTFAIETIRRYIDWKGVIDFQVQIKAGTESPYPNADGILPSTPGWFFNTPGKAELAAPVEAVTGVDPNGATPDAGFTIYLAKDGQVRNYGDLVWMDPNPQFGVTPSIPAGQHDLVGIAIHELFHCFGFATWVQQKAAFDQQVITANGNRYFNGANVLALLGEPLPIQADGDHYGSDVVSSPVKSGLMYIWGNYYGNRLDIGRLDLAVLKDLGWNIISTDNLALVDLLDYAPNVVGNGKMTALYGDSKNNVITGTSINETIVGGSGSDTIDGGVGMDTSMYSSAKSSYTVTRSGATITVKKPSNEQDTLTNVERIKFSDSGVALDLGANQSAGQTALLLGAVLPGKLALDSSKQSLLGAVIGLFDSSYSMADLSGALLRLDIWSTLTAQNIKPTSRTLAENTVIVKYLMSNVYGIVPDDNTLKANADVMHNEKFQGAWLAQLALSSASQDHIGLVGLATTGITYG